MRSLASLSLVATMFTPAVACVAFSQHVSEGASTTVSEGAVASTPPASGQCPSGSTPLTYYYSYGSAATPVAGAFYVESSPPSYVPSNAIKQAVFACAPTSGTTNSVAILYNTSDHQLFYSVSSSEETSLEHGSPDTSVVATYRAYATPQPGTQPLTRCVNAAGTASVLSLVGCKEFTANGTSLFAPETSTYNTTGGLGYVYPAPDNGDAYEVSALVNAYVSPNIAVAGVGPTKSQAVGALTGVYFKGKPYYFPLGVMDVNQTPPANDTHFLLASVTKTFTTTIIGVENSTTLDEGVPAVLTSPIPATALPPGVRLSAAESSLTMAELGNFTSGFKDGYGSNKGDTDQESFVADVNKVNAPSSSCKSDTDCNANGGSSTCGKNGYCTTFSLPQPYSYSNFGNGFLGQVLATQAGYGPEGSNGDCNAESDAGPYNQICMQDWFSAKVLLPLGMSQTSTHPTGDISTAFNAGSWTWGDVSTKGVTTYDTWIADGACWGLYSTGSDMMNYLMANVGADSSTTFPFAIPNQDGSGTISVDQQLATAMTWAHYGGGTESHPNFLPNVGDMNAAGQAWAWFLADADLGIIAKDGVDVGAASFIGFAPGQGGYGAFTIANTSGTPNIYATTLDVIKALGNLETETDGGL